MLFKEIKEKNTSDLSKLLLDLKKELFNLRFQKSAGQLTNSSKVRVVRRTIARIKTLINERLLNKNLAIKD